MRFFMLFLLFWPMSLFAGPFADADFNIVNGKVQADIEKNIISNSILGSSQDMAMLLTEMELVIKDKDPDLVLKMSGKSDDEKFVIYRSKLSELAFDEYEKAFVTALNQKSKEIGRKLKKREYSYGCTSEVYYWLDNGELDSAECDINRPDLSDREWVDWVTEHACFYPDGYEEHMVVIKNYNTCNKVFDREFTTRSIVAIDDYEDKNETITYVISLSDRSTHSISEEFQDLFLSVTQTSVDYDKHHLQRNQEVEDIRDGMYEYSGKTYPDGSKELYTIDYSKNWKSVIGSETRVRDHTYYFMSSAQRRRSGNE